SPTALPARGSMFAARGSCQFDCPMRLRQPAEIGMMAEWAGTTQASSGQEVGSSSPSTDSPPSPTDAGMGGQRQSAASPHTRSHFVNLCQPVGTGEAEIEILQVPILQAIDPAVDAELLPAAPSVLYNRGVT